MKHKIRLGLLGASGRMGQKVQELLALQENADLDLIWSASHTDEPSFEKLKRCPLDLVIDFSNPKLTLEAAKIIGPRKIAFLVCTTGFKPGDKSSLDKALSKSLWAFCPNTSKGVLAFTIAARKVAELLTDWDVSLVESHHKQKKDSPSGTAKLLHAELLRAGVSPLAPILAMRGGSEVGEHVVEFFGLDERVRIEHRAQDRRLFARGALELARRLVKKKARAAAYSAEELFSNGKSTF